MKSRYLLFAICSLALWIGACRASATEELTRLPATAPPATVAVATPPAAPANSWENAPVALVGDDEAGERLVVLARVVDDDTDRPVDGAAVYVRQTSAAGSYEEDESGEPRIRGTMVSDENGRLHFATILPGAYADDPTASRHIHVTVTADGYAPLERVILFDNDPNLTPAERTWEFGIVAEMSQDGAGAWTTEIALPLTPDGSAAPRRFVVAPGSTASYHVEEEFFDRLDWLERHGLAPGPATAIGSTDQVEGFVELDLSQTPLQVGESAFAVDLLGLTSDQEGRDNTVRREIFGDGRYPTATFVVHSVEAFPAQYTAGEQVSFLMRGELTIREVTQVVDFDVVATPGDRTIEAVASSSFLMSDFGIEPPELLGVLSVSDTVVITLDVTLERDG